LRGLLGRPVILAVRVAVLAVLLAVAAPGIVRPAEGQPPRSLVPTESAAGGPVGTTEPTLEPTSEPPPTQPPGGVPGDIIPDPSDPGPEPDDPGDRGGWLQLSVLLLIVVAILVMVLLVWRESRARRSGDRN
jgi:hypothetical protein